MANSLKMYNDAALTSERVTPLVAAQNVDGSSPPAQFQLWLGSTIANRKFEASSSPGVDQIVLQPVNATLVWSASTAKTTGNEVRTTSKNGYKYTCTSAGTTGVGEPVWPIVIGNTVVDGGVTWECMEKIHEATEMRIATTSGGLSGAVNGAALNVGAVQLSEAGNAFEFWVQVDDTTEVVATRTELSVRTNETDETDV